MLLAHSHAENLIDVVIYAPIHHIHEAGKHYLQIFNPNSADVKEFTLT